MQIIKKLPKSKSPNPNATNISKQAAKSCKARHAISVTLKGRHGLIYFEPLVAGGETISDINSLYCIAKNMCKKLSRGMLKC